MAMILQEKQHSCVELMEYINEIGFLPKAVRLSWINVVRGIRLDNITLNALILHACTIPFVLIGANLVKKLRMKNKAGKFLPFIIDCYFSLQYQYS